MERGILVHAALAAFWRDVVDHATLIVVVAGRFPAARSTRRSRPRRRRFRRDDGAGCPPWWRPVKRPGSRRRVRAWLDDFDRLRPPFTVAAVEAREAARAGRPPVATAPRSHRRACRRRDRDHRLQDRQSSRRPPSGSTLARRSRSSGSIGSRSRHFDGARPVRAVAYAQLRPGEMKAVGLAADASAVARAARAIGAQGRRTRRLARRRRPLAPYARRAGGTRSAKATRRSRRAMCSATCQRCGLQSLCRIGALAIDGDTENGDD